MLALAILVATKLQSSALLPAARVQLLALSGHLQRIGHLPHPIALGLVESVELLLPTDPGLDATDPEARTLPRHSVAKETLLLPRTYSAMRHLSSHRKQSARSGQDSP